MRAGVQEGAVVDQAHAPEPQGRAGNPTARYVDIQSDTSGCTKGSFDIEPGVYRVTHQIIYQVSDIEDEFAFDDFVNIYLTSSDI